MPFDLALKVGNNLLNLTTRAGGLYLNNVPYSPGLEMTSTIGARSVLTGGSDSSTVSCSFYSVFDFSQLDALVGSEATLLLVESGIVVHKGTIDSVQVGLDSGKVELSIADRRALTDLTFPPALAGDKNAQGVRRHPNAPKEAFSLTVPIIMGRVIESPLVQITDPEIVGITQVNYLIAGHAIASTEILVVDDKGIPVQVQPLQVFRSLDTHGSPFSYVSIDLAVLSPDLLTANLYAQELLGYEGLTQLGDILEKMFRIWGGSLELDYERISRATPALNRWSASLRFDAQSTGTTLGEVLRGRVEQQFPVVFGSVGGLFGWDAAIWPSPDQRPVTRLVLGQNCWPSSTTMTKGGVGSVINTYQVSLRESGRTAGGVEAVFVGPENSAPARASASLYGRSAPQQVSYPDLYVASEARAIIEDQIRWTGFLRWTVEYEVPFETAYGLFPPALVELNDMRLGAGARRLVVVDWRAESSGRTFITGLLD
jgi:hypothetical protein